MHTYKPQTVINNGDTINQGNFDISNLYDYPIKFQRVDTDSFDVQDFYPEYLSTSIHTIVRTNTGLYLCVDGRSGSGDSLFVRVPAIPLVITVFFGNVEHRFLATKWNFNHKNINSSYYCELIAFNFEDPVTPNGKFRYDIVFNRNNFKRVLFAKNLPFSSIQNYLQLFASGSSFTPQLVFNDNLEREITLPSVDARNGQILTIERNNEPVIIKSRSWDNLPDGSDISIKENAFVQIIESDGKYRAYGLFDIIPVSVNLLLGKNIVAVDSTVTFVGQIGDITVNQSFTEGNNFTRVILDIPVGTDINVGDTIELSLASLSGDGNGRLELLPDDINNSQIITMTEADILQAVIPACSKLTLRLYANYNGNLATFARFVGLILKKI